MKIQKCPLAAGEPTNIDGLGRVDGTHRWGPVDFALQIFLSSHSVRLECVLTILQLRGK